MLDHLQVRVVRTAVLLVSLCDYCKVMMSSAEINKNNNNESESAEAFGQNPAVGER